MVGRRLNNRQEEELVRLVAFEREKCSVDGRQPFHCAFPLRRDDRNQNDLIKLGMLAVKRTSGQSRTSAGHLSPSGVRERVVFLLSFFTRATP